MKTHPQIIFLGTTPYEILVEPHQLQEFGHPENVIRFEGLPFKDGSYEFTYDTKNNKVVSDPHQILEGYEKVSIPFSVAFLDAQCEPRQLEHFNKSSQEGLWGIYLAEAYMRGYLKRRPIEFEFEGTTFTLDTQKLHLIERSDPNNRIRIQDISASPEGYFMDYNTLTRNLAKPGDNPEHIIPFTLDQLVNYDPLGMAKKHQISVGRLPKWDNDLNSERVVKACRSYSGEYPVQDHQKRKQRKGKSL